MHSKLRYIELCIILILWALPAAAKSPVMPSFMNYARQRLTDVSYSDITGLTMENVWPDAAFDFEENAIPSIYLDSLSHIFCADYSSPSSIDPSDYTLEKLSERGVINTIDPYQIKLYDMADTVKLDMRGFYAPLERSVTSEFGRRRGRIHYGIDLQAYKGDTLHCAFDGIVRVTRYDRRGYGNFVIVHHANGVETLYGHLSKYLTHIGDTLKAGDPVGLGGRTGRATGYHLHFEIRYLGNAINPRDAIDYYAHKPISDTLVITKDNFQYQTLTVARGGRRIYPKGVATITVHRGDTLGRIASHYGTTVANLRKLNGLQGSTIVAGQKLRVK